MSISLVLVPVAVAAVSAWQARQEKVDAEGRTVLQVQTRMKDRGLLVAALQETQADVTSTTDTLTARWAGVEAVFEQDADGIWQAHFTGDVDMDRAASIISAIDVAYGLQVQQAVLGRLRERAPTVGMSVESETVDDDASVTLVLNVGATT